jgi:serine/threonine protein kinase
MEKSINGLMMDYIQGPTLESIYFRHKILYKPIKLPIIIRIARTIFEFLDHIHTLGYVHGDIKDSNMIVSSKGVRVIDFNFFTDLNKPGPYVCRGTRLFMSPQLLNKLSERGHVETKLDMIKNDIWGVGVILYELCHLKEPYPEKQGIEDLIENKYRIRVTQPKQCDKLRKLISLCLRKLPSQRLSAAKALEMLRDIDESLDKRHISE